MAILWVLVGFFALFGLCWCLVSCAFTQVSAAVPGLRPAPARVRKGEASLGLLYHEDTRSRLQTKTGVRPGGVNIFDAENDDL